MKSSSLNDLCKQIKEPDNLTIDTYNNILDNNHSLGLPVKSFQDLRHLEKSLRRRSKSIVQPEEIEVKLTLQNQNKKKKHSLIEQQILKINVARYSKKEQKQRCHIIRRKSLAQFPLQNDISQFGFLSRTSVKSIEGQTQIKQKNDMMVEKIKRNQQSYKEIESQFHMKLKEAAQLKSQIQKNRIQVNRIKIENSKRLQAEQALQKKIFALEEQIKIKSEQKEQILQVFSCLKVSFEVQKQIRDYMSQKQKIERLYKLQLRLKERHHKLMLQKKQLQNCTIHSEKHLQWMKLQAQYSQLQLYHKQLLKMQSKKTSSICN